MPERFNPQPPFKYSSQSERRGYSTREFKDPLEERREAALKKHSLKYKDRIRNNIVRASFIIAGALFGAKAGEYIGNIAVASAETSETVQGVEYPRLVDEYLSGREGEISPEDSMAIRKLESEVGSGPVLLLLARARKAESLPSEKNIEIDESYNLQNVSTDEFREAVEYMPRLLQFGNRRIHVLQTLPDQNHRAKYGPKVGRAVAVDFGVDSTQIAGTQSAYYIFYSMLHEQTHSIDPYNNDFMSLHERLMVAQKMIDIAKEHGNSDDYVSRIQNANPQEELYLKSVEYFADLVPKYLMGHPINSNDHMPPEEDLRLIERLLNVYETTPDTLVQTKNYFHNLAQVALARDSSRI